MEASAALRAAEESVTARPSVGTLVKLAQDRGWTVQVIATRPRLSSSMRQRSRKRLATRVSPVAPQARNLDDGRADS